MRVFAIALPLVMFLLFLVQIWLGERGYQLQKHNCFGLGFYFLFPAPESRTLPTIAGTPRVLASIEQDTREHREPS